eukprot:Skav200167  [mRNA]  locus=scaffold6219:79799:80895:+ [translate_table: standard]
MDASTATTSAKERFLRDKNAIMSSNLFISQLMLSPWRFNGGVSLKIFGAAQLQIGCGIIVAGSTSPLGFDPQMPMC